LFFGFYLVGVEKNLPQKNQKGRRSNPMRKTKKQKKKKKKNTPRGARIFYNLVF
jgi:hypothetical protein